MTGPMTGAAGYARPIDPLAPTEDGVYLDDLVEVRRLGAVLPRRTLGMVRTPHFDVTRSARRLQVAHRVPPEQLDDRLAGLVAAELFAPGWLRGPDLLERIVTGVVVSCDPDPLAAWERYYRNTLAAAGGTGHAELGAVHAHARRLLAPGSVLELGSCFGFLALSLAAAGRRTTASDVVPGTVALVTAMARRLGVPLATLVADAGDVPLSDGAADTVLALHLLEHLEPEHGDRVLAEALRLARRRVVVAVPLEEVPDETWGHVRSVRLEDLRAWGAASGGTFDVHEHHGGWLVIDRR